MMITAAHYKAEEDRRSNPNPNHNPPAYGTIDGNEDDATQYYIDALTNMGYNGDHIDIVLSSVDPNNTTLEELLSQLNELAVSVTACMRVCIYMYIYVPLLYIILTIYIYIHIYCL